jgi:hypothetical protein
VFPCRSLKWSFPTTWCYTEAEIFRIAIEDSGTKLALSMSSMFPTNISISKVCPKMKKKLDRHLKHVSWPFAL